MPDNSLALSSLEQALVQARARAEQGEIAAAALALQALLPHEALMPAVHNNLGALYHQQGRIEDAARRFAAAACRDPDHINAHLNLAQTCLARKWHAEALAALYRVLRIDPGDAGLKRQIARLRAAPTAGEAPPVSIWPLPSPLLSLLPGPAAFPSAQDPDDPTGKDGPIARELARANQLVNGKHLDEAVRVLENVLGAEPLFAEIHNDLGALLFQLRRPEEAALHFTAAALRHPGYATAYQNLAELLPSLGQDEAAIAAAERAIALDSTDTASATILERLRSQARGDAPAPLVSAIVSTYNSERFLRGCLQDLIEQTLFAQGQLEIIVVDSGSEQGERAIVEEFQARHRNIRYVRTARETLYAAWNRGIAIARGKYLTNANVDDKHAPDALERLAAYLEADPAAGLAFADDLVVEVECATWATATTDRLLRWPDHDPRLIFDICMAGPHPLWRRALHEEVGLFDGRYKSAGDYEFWLRLSTWGVRFVHLREPLGLYLERSGGISLSNRDLNWKESERCRDRYWPADQGPRPRTRWRSFIRPLTKGKQRRFLLCCDYYWPSVGGVELFVEDLGRKLVAAGHHVEISARFLPERQATEHAGMRIHQFKCDGGLWSNGATGEVAEYRRLVHEGGFDAVFLLSQPDNWVPSCLKNLPECHPQMVLLPSVNAANIEDWVVWNRLGGVLDVVRSADEVVCVSESGLDAQLLQRAGIQSHYIPHGVERDAAPANFRELHGLRTDRPLLVMVANFWPVKNHLGLLKALASAKGDWQLAIIGHPIAAAPDCFRDASAQAALDPRVRIFPGLPREIAASAIRDADLLLVPSLGESAGPLVVLQAMSYGTPWIATPACNAVHDQAGGLVTSLPEFPAAIARLLGDRDARTRLGREGQAHWERCFTWERTLPAFLAVAESRYPIPDLRMPAELRGSRPRTHALSLDALLAPRR